MEQGLEVMCSDEPNSFSADGLQFLEEIQEIFEESVGTIAYKFFVPVLSHSIKHFWY